MKNLKITVNGVTYDVQVEEANGQATPAKVATAPAAPAKSAPVVVATPSAGAETVNAPMPGTILSINVKAGDSVKKGQCLVILEAMKMENEIMAPRDGVVAGVHANKGDSVESGSALVSLQ